MTNIIQLPYKEKLDSSKLIEDVLKYNGVKFVKVTETEAKKYLDDFSYYYKVTSYRKNFHKDKRDKYIDLDFQNLISTSKFDKELRYILLRMTLDIEHLLKTKILKSIAHNSLVDGYDIVQDYIYSYNSKNSVQISINSLIERAKNQNNTNHGIFKKVSSSNNYIAVWQLLEMLQFRELQEFFDYYYSRFTDSSIELIPFKSLIISTRYIRNAAAHNSPILINLPSCPEDAFKNKGINNKYVNNLLEIHFRNASTPKSLIPTYRFKDICAVLKIYSLLKPHLNKREDKLLMELDTLLSSIYSSPPCPSKNNDLHFFLTYLRKIFFEIFN